MLPFHANVPKINRSPSSCMIQTCFPIIIGSGLVAVSVGLWLNYVPIASLVGASLGPLALACLAVAGGLLIAYGLFHALNNQGPTQGKPYRASSADTPEDKLNFEFEDVEPLENLIETRSQCLWRIVKGW